ncbi:glycosyl transferase family protein [Sphingobium sp. CR28]|uniref:glycosyl transferase family protein n=1 Tax=Sphingobium sp. CR28 TaxID=3400272 RepID=UPI003FEFE76D
MLTVLAFVRDELLLFAAVGLLAGGLDDLCVDLIYIVRRLWRRIAIYSRFPKMTTEGLPPVGSIGPVAVFVPAWDESAVIGQMVRGCMKAWGGEDVHLFIGVYPNDKPTIAAIAQALSEGWSDHVTVVINGRPGPTTKADALNCCWRAMLRWEKDEKRRMRAVVLHDAEDVVHPDSIRLIGWLAERFSLVQLPVLPLVASGSRWISGHYCDEFAEAHGKALLVREALGASMPSAGVGCGFSRSVMGEVARRRDGSPFDESSLTEDYELGLRISEMGGRGILVRMRDARGALIATQEYFPDTLSAAVKQKARWTVGIALAGWDRLGWSGGLGETWMRLRDRRATLAAIVLLAAYAGMLLTAGLWMIEGLALISLPPLPPALTFLLGLNAALLVWRLSVRACFVWEAYGPAEALRSVPRTFVANIVQMLAARRALIIYLRHLRGEKLVWDKTAHRFPDQATVA